MKNILLALALLCLAFYGYQRFQVKNAADNVDSFKDIPLTYNDAVSEPETIATVANAQSFSCDGREHCSQMSSCAEATYFVQHCPNTKMDGNNDGVPCEQQWCN